MHFHRLAALLLGAWLGGSILVTVARTQSQSTVDQIIRQPARQAVDLIAKLQESEARMVLLYQASENNRWLVGSWEIAQLILGVFLLLALLMSSSGTRYPTVICLLMIGSVIFLHWFLTPRMEDLARAAVFARMDQVSVARDRLRSLQTGYTTVDSLKLTLGVLAAWGLLRRRHRSHREVEIDG